MTDDLTRRRNLALIHVPSFRPKQADPFSALPLPRKVGLRREKSLFAFAGFIAGLIVLALALNAQAPVAVPIPKEPHHHLVLENEYVRVFRVSVPAHDATLLHQHDVPYLYVSLGPADVINAVQGKPEARIVMADGQVGYSPGHFAHIARTDAGSTFNNVTIELLHPQGEPKNRCENVVPGDKSSCTVERGESSYTITPLFETAEISVLFVRLRPKALFQEFPDRDRLLVALDQATLLVQTQGKPEVNLTGGNSVWLSRLRSQTIQNSVNSPSSFLSISFKDSSLRRVY